MQAAMECGDEITCPLTPSRKTTLREGLETPVSSLKQRGEQTPRRSTRKSIKPPQDYEEIVGRTLRSNRKLVQTAANDADEKENIEDQPQPKWTPAKVGRVSTKRSTRRGKKSKLFKQEESLEKNKTCNINSEQSEIDVYSNNATLTLEEKENGSIAPIEIADNLKETERTVRTLGGSTTDVYQSGQDVSSLIKEDILTSEIAEPTEMETDEMPLNMIDLDVNVPNDSSYPILISPKNPTLGKNTLATDAPMIESVSENKTFDDKEEFQQIVQSSDSTTMELQDDQEVVSSPKEKIINVQLNKSNEILEIAANPQNEENDKSGNEDLKDQLVTETKSSFDLTKAIENENDNDEVFEDNEMPSLIFCDDDDSDANQDGNDTFNASDCVIISPAMETTKEIPTIRIVSPDTETANEIPTIQVVSQPLEAKTDSPLVQAAKKVKEIQAKYFSPKPKTPAKTASKNIETTPGKDTKTPQFVSKRVMRGTPVRSNAANISERPNSAKTGYQFPTPSKLVKNFNFRKTDKSNSLKVGGPNSPAALLLTSLEPKDIVLRSIRKRSLSVTIDGAERKRTLRNVTFHSPANETITIDDVDFMITKSALKEKVLKPVENRNGREPRKRSLSFDENITRFQSKLPRRIVAPTKAVPTRTKLPNFAAIHEKQFKKMENVVDYVARKAERAQNLTNSALKAKNVSATTSKLTQKEKPKAAKALPLAMPCNDIDQPDKFLNVSAITSKLIQKEKPKAAKALPLAMHMPCNDIDKPDKLLKRRERHEAMFKSRTATDKNKKSKNSEIIRGVRSNRRFDLLMQHRKTGGT